MKNINKKILITMIIIPTILIGAIGYKIYSKNKILRDFNRYLISYQEEIKTYILTDNKENYENLIKEYEQAILDKNSNKAKELKLTLNQFKEDLLKANVELVNKNIEELEAIDISKLNDKELILSKIDDIKKLRYDKKFININDEFTALKANINLALEAMKQEEYKAIKNIDGNYEYNEYNENGFLVRGYNLSLITCGENKLLIDGGHNTALRISKDNKDIKIEDATKENERDTNYRGGTVGGELDYIGNYTWTGFIWDDQGSNNIKGDNGLSIGSIPIEIIFENNNLIVTTESGSGISGKYTLIKSKKETKSTEFIEKRKKELNENPRKMTEREALSLVEKECNTIKEYEKITISSNLSGIKPTKNWGLPAEEYYIVTYSIIGGKSYLVAKESKLVYSIANQGYTPAYLMKNKSTVQKYEFIEA